MLEKRIEKKHGESKFRDENVEMESQFILRIPEEPATILHDALHSGNLRDRLSLKMDSDLRYGQVRFDHWLLHAKILDLPTIIESLKTIDNKSFYKTADICQIMICKEEPDAPLPEDETQNKIKKKDPTKVDKKFLWPHGVTPPCKNVRKRRFRKTLKKKYVEAPEIEKEVKRLLRIDNDAVNVKYEIINEDDDKSGSIIHSKDHLMDADDILHERKLLSNRKDIIIESDLEEGHARMVPGGMRRVGEHDIFGEEVSSSDDEDRRALRETDDISRMSAYDSRLSDDDSMSGLNTSREMITEFNKTMFDSPKGTMKSYNRTNMGSQSSYYEKRNDSDDEYYNDTHITRDQVNVKIMDLRRQVDDLKLQQMQKSQEVSSIQNATLKQRLQETVENLLSQIVEKELEIQDYQNML